MIPERLKMKIEKHSQRTTKEKEYAGLERK